MKLILCLLFLISSVFSGVKRYALIAGVNNGGSNRVPLQYAFKDAESLANVLNTMGGVPAEQQILLENPTAQSFAEGIDILKNWVAMAPKEDRTEIFVYYSGHADEIGLLFGKDRFGYQNFRKELDAIPADVRITILDACASGAITRLKGGKRKQAFLVDASNELTGYAFLTSSSSDESSQESDRIEASFFTHFLVSGLHGAADMSNDGKVTLSEAYQYAFHETLARTEQTLGGAQHPSYDMKLSGSGDVVVTDLRDGDASLSLDKEMEGRFWVRDQKDRLVLEVKKQEGQLVDLALAHGEYSLSWQEGSTWKVQSFAIATGEVKRLNGKDNWKKGSVEQTSLRGKSTTQKYGLNIGIGAEVDSSFRGVQLSPFYSVSRKSFSGIQLSLVGANEAKNYFEGVQYSMFYNRTHNGGYGVQSTTFLNLNTSLEGISFSGISNVNTQGMQGAQIAGISNYSDTLKGVQAAGIGNFNLNGGEGAQVAGVVNLNLEAFDGIQVAGVANLNDKFSKGVQVAGVINLHPSSKQGVHIAGVANASYSGRSNVQIGGVSNLTEYIEGAQVAGVLNVAKKVDGVQVSGVLNVADTVHGAQLGFVNFSNHNEGIALGFLSYANNGLFSLSYEYNELDFHDLSLRSGNSWLYNILTIDNLHKTPHSIGWGVGAHYSQKQMFGEWENKTRFIRRKSQQWNDIFQSQNHLLYTTQLNLGFKLHKHIHVVAGMSWNVVQNLNDENSGLPVLSVSKDWEHKISEGWASWPGFSLGLRFARF